jgi:nucleotide-binding universal stress UspA family protein
MKVMVAIDQSAFWPQVMDALLSRDWLPGTQFKILTVVEPLPFRWEDIADEEWKNRAHELAEKRRCAAEKVVLDARYKLQHQVSDCIVHTDVRQGRARDEIVNAALDWVPDKIILGAHGRSANRLFPGAVSHTVARHAPCSVELVRLKEPTELVPNRAGVTGAKKESAVPAK